jgi:hypothetical protein
VEWQAFDEFAGLSGEKRAAFMAAFLEGGEDADSASLSLAASLFFALEQTSNSQDLSEIALRRLSFVSARQLARENNAPSLTEVPAYPPFQGTPAALLRKTPAWRDQAVLPEDAGLVFDSADTFLLLPGADTRAALTAAASAELLSFEEARFQITRASATAAFDAGFSPDVLLSALGTLSKGRVDSTLEWNLRDWYKSYGEVELRDGPVLLLAPERRYLAGKGSPLAPFIEREASPGIYFLRGRRGWPAHSPIADALKAAGVELFSTGGADAATGGFNLRLTTLPKVPKIDSNGRTVVYETEKAAALQAAFRKFAVEEGLSEQNEIERRIANKIIVSTRQLVNSHESVVEAEARGLDYNGKLTLARQAAASGTIVEIRLTGGSGLVRGKAVSFSRNNGRATITVRGWDRETIAPIGKINSIKLLKSFLV